MSYVLELHGNIVLCWYLLFQSNESLRTKMKMEKDLAKVKNIMEGLSKEGARLQEVMSTLRKGAPGAGPGNPTSPLQSSKL